MTFTMNPSITIGTSTCKTKGAVTTFKLGSLFDILRVGEIEWVNDTAMFVLDGDDANIRTQCLSFLLGHFGNAKITETVTTSERYSDVYAYTTLTRDVMKAVLLSVPPTEAG